MFTASRLGQLLRRGVLSLPAAVLGVSTITACAPTTNTPTATASAPAANFTGVWDSPGRTIDDGVAAGYPVNIGSTEWALLSAGPPEQAKLQDFDTVKTEVEKIINDKGDVFAWARSRAFRPPLTEAAMATQKAAMAARAKEPRAPYARCLPGNSIGIGGTAQIFQTEKRVVIVPENGSVRSIYIDGEAGRENSNTAYAGYSAGRWEGKSLVVTTTNFLGDTINGWPASDQAKVEETYTLSEDGNRLSVKIVYSDAVNLKEPVARMVYLDRKPEDTLLIESNCLENLAGAAEFARTLGHNYDQGVLP